MPVSLSRIEREYVIRSLEDMPTPLSILAGNSLFHIPESEYAIASGCILVTGFASRVLESPEIRVFFRHRQRGLFFNARIELLDDGRVSFGISDDLFKEDISDSRTGSPRITVISGSLTFEALALPPWPLDCVMVNPAVSLERAETIAKLAAKAGIAAENPLLSCRLFDYLDSFRTQPPSALPGSRSGDFVYIDHANVLVALRNTGKSVFVAGQELPVHIFYDNRTIRCPAIISGIIPVQANLELLSLSIGSAQEEDKRFLFEKLHKFKYRG